MQPAPQAVVEPPQDPSPKGVGDHPWARLSGPAAATVAAAQWSAARERVQQRGGQASVEEAEAARRVLAVAAQESPYSAVASERELWRAAVRHVASRALLEEADVVLADVVSWTLRPAPAGAAPAVAAVPPVPAQDASLLLEVEAVQRDSEHIAAVLSEQVRVLTHMQDTVFVLQDSVAQLQQRLAALHSMAGQGRPT